MKNIITIENVEKHFANQVIIPSLSLDIQEGEFLTILGPSGCGKTTLLRMIAGFEKPSKGAIKLDGKVINDLEPYKRDMNMVFQNYALFPHMTVEENIRFGLKMKGVSNKEQKERAEEVLHLTQLTELRSRKPKQLSGGQQQRVAIARAVVNNPKVLLLDEPLGALDFKLRKDLQRELKNLQRNLGITFVYVTHDQEEAMSMSDRVAVMNNGKVEQLGTPEEIYYKPKSLFVATFIGENNIVKDGERLFALRPEKIRTGSPSDTGMRTGVVEDVEFLGNHHKMYIREESGENLFIAYQPTDKDAHYKVNDIIGFGWNKEDEVDVT
ncbi:ABC transporter ATP-binding protein [Priestia taiwanensis]|uniref:Spermidine/putrescine import ATP-binding protein PotA n=1 Tax=Priestia taiwanensis TaxID=1347902 RepID=A0A917EQF0_9BACI|nr:ABC transporter ATP-binding protein [Priestia taiwanensis]MBM7364067.1 spermidine/putrescine transport system ATP-binding protein [Priestia taiwanensis]GGE71353.1 spermidine/putrescine import ATP-binding protein PotA [Priestia taiwanensis]